jgi:hypothetical protein
MVDQATARELVLSEMYKKPISADFELVVLDEQTIERPFGWVFFYNTRKYAETGDRRASLIGNCPIVVERMTGRLTRLATGDPLDAQLARYEAQRAKL